MTLGLSSPVKSLKDARSVITSEHPCYYYGVVLRTAMVASQRLGCAMVSSHCFCWLNCYRPAIFVAVLDSRPLFSDLLSRF